ncbi:MAG: hypothetical protein IPK46_07615 [Saprospiraceae bacterium]|nr:hypothetical protein [Saprospiraceae bacterium]
MSLHILTEPSIQIDPEILAELTNETEEAGQVVLHILYNTPMHTFMNIRIWPSTYLFDQHSNHRSELVHVENICLYPNWMPCFPGEKFHFTLIFSGLPKIVRCLILLKFVTTRQAHLKHVACIAMLPTSIFWKYSDSEG